MVLLEVSDLMMCVYGEGGEHLNCLSPCWSLEHGTQVEVHLDVAWPLAQGAKGQRFQLLSCYERIKVHLFFFCMRKYKS